jgi:flagellar hook assembly protein FlgD
VGARRTLPLDILSVKTSNTRAAGNPAYRFAVLTTQDAEVNLEVKSLQGQTIRRLTTRSEAGKEATILWDGRAASGNPLPAGPYTVSVTVRDANGAIAQRSIPTISIR